MVWGAVALVDVPAHTRRRFVELVRYVYAEYNQLLSPLAYALITYHSEKPGECWLNMFDRRYVMVSFDFYFGHSVQSSIAGCAQLAPCEVLYSASSCSAYPSNLPAYANHSSSC